MPQESTPVCEPALQLQAELMLWLSGGRYRSGQSVNTILNALAAAGSLSPAGSVVGSVTAAYATNADLSTQIPSDDTIPQVTEGTQIISVTITPKSTTNKLRCSFTGTISSTIAQTPGVALFLNGATNAIKAAAATVPAANFQIQISFIHEFVPGSTSLQTLTVRAGPNTGTAMRFNGQGAGRIYGGAQAAVLVVEEIKA